MDFNHQHQRSSETPHTTTSTAPRLQDFEQVQIASYLIERTIVTARVYLGNLHSYDVVMLHRSDVPATPYRAVLVQHFADKEYLGKPRSGAEMLYTGDGGTRQVALEVLLRRVEGMLSDRIEHALPGATMVPYAEGMDLFLQKMRLKGREAQMTDCCLM